MLSNVDLQTHLKITFIYLSLPYIKKMNKVRKVIEYMIVDFCVTKIKLGWIRINISALEIKLTLL